MAKKDESKSKKSKSSKEAKKTVSMRESAAKNREKAAKPKRVRKAAEVATKPLSRVNEVATKQRHIFPKSGTDSFWHRERTIAPTWFVNAWNELRQVTWPSRKETWRLVLAVFIFSALLSLFIALLDNALETLFRNIFL